MIVVSVQYTDYPQTATTNNNGGAAVVFQVLAEAKLFAQIESKSSEYGLTNSAALCRVYIGGYMIQAWLNGVNVTA
tara:strand:- start:463 stop:690 length:228 start_codon:yes stop_codon:yes gene_type:complete